MNPVSEGRKTFSLEFFNIFILFYSIQKASLWLVEECPYPNCKALKYPGTGLAGDLFKTVCCSSFAGSTLK